MSQMDVGCPAYPFWSGVERIDTNLHGRPMLWSDKLSLRYSDEHKMHFQFETVAI